MASPGATPTRSQINLVSHGVDRVEWRSNGNEEALLLQDMDSWLHHNPDLPPPMLTFFSYLSDATSSLLLLTYHLLDQERLALHSAERVAVGDASLVVVA